MDDQEEYANIRLGYFARAWLRFFIPSEARQPQLVVLPPVRLQARTFLLRPQSHLQNQRTRPFLFFPA